jgi:hypothetical protein
MCTELDQLYWVDDKSGDLLDRTTQNSTKLYWVNDVYSVRFV